MSHSVAYEHKFLADGIHFFPIGPDFVWSAGKASSAACGADLGLFGLTVSVKSHDGAERAVLEPADEELTKGK